MRGILFLIAAFMMFSDTEPVQAQSCAPSEFSGNWKNVRGEAHILASLEVVDTCDEKSSFGPVKVRAKELCHPRDCSWGWAAAFIRGDHLFAEFKTFIAVRRVTASKQGRRLKVIVETYYITESREDLKATHLLVRSAD